MSKTVQMVAVHYANRSGRGKAAFFLTYEAARELVDARMAQWSKGAKYLNLMRTESELFRPKSLRMGPKVSEGCIEGRMSDIACRNIWRFIPWGVYCPLEKAA